MSSAFPDPTAEVTQILVVSDIDAARRFYAEVLGAEVLREYGGTSVVLRPLGAWLLLVTSGSPTADKPTVTFTAPADPDSVSHAMTIRVANCFAAYTALQARGAPFLTPPVENPGEIRAFFRDPDGHLFEISEARSG